MKKELVQVLTIKGEQVTRITTLDERWYSKQEGEDAHWIYAPSDSWISCYTPPGIALMKWYASKGWEEAEMIKRIRGDAGSKVHYAFADYMRGKRISMEDKYINHSTMMEEELTVEEYECIVSGHNWFQPINPSIEILGIEITAFGYNPFHAGTTDYIIRLRDKITVNRTIFNKGIWLWDVKTSQQIWANHRAQLNGYSLLDYDLEKLKITKEEWKKRQLATLQLGYRRNQLRYKMTPIKRDPDLFSAAYKFWEDENKDKEPKQRDYPMFVQRKGGEKDVQKGRA